MIDDKIIKWMYLTTVCKISKTKLLLLYNHFGCADKILSANKYELEKLDFLTNEEIECIINRDFSGLEEQAHMLQKNSVKVLTIECSEYPELLRHIKTPPLVLYCRGKFINLNNYLCIASIGSRTPTAYGKAMTRTIVKDLCKKGFLIVSGMAQGIDAVSHIAAMETGFPTVAFVATGVDIIYPRLNAELHKAILKSGMIVSEYPPGTLPKNYYFLERNRLVAGVSMGVFISEATVNSGSSSTVSFAVEQGKDVFALPGNANSELSAEPNRLIKQGAYAVTEANDIINHYKDVYNLNMVYAKRLESERTAALITNLINTGNETLKKEITVPENLSNEEKVIFSIKNSFNTIDAISHITKLSLSELDVILLMLEMNGKIRNDNGIYMLLD